MPKTTTTTTTTNNNNLNNNNNNNLNNNNNNNLNNNNNNNNNNYNNNNNNNNLNNNNNRSNNRSNSPTHERKASAACASNCAPLQQHTDLLPLLVSNGANEACFNSCTCVCVNCCPLLPLNEIARFGKVVVKPLEALAKVHAQLVGFLGLQVIALLVLLDLISREGTVRSKKAAREVEPAVPAFSFPERTLALNVSRL